ncbi:MAG: TniB family NTP-binding protein [Burkholderiaceae bacterium]
MSDAASLGALQIFEEQYIPFPPFVAAKDAIEANLALFRETGLASHLLVLGESGTGKSSLCRWLGTQHPRRQLPDGDTVEALIVSVPPAATIAGIADQMLKELGDPVRNSGTVTHKTSRVVTLCRACRVETMLFDEAQHLHDRGDTRTHYMVADWLKHLIDEVAVPTVLLGLPRLESLLQINEQLRRRFSRRLRLALGQSDTDDIETECLQLFISLASCLEVGVSAEPYSWREMGMRLYYASDGRVAYVKKMLAAALRQCLERDLPRIDVVLLERVFVDEIWWEGVGPLNPFNAGFEFRRLDRGGEPFQRAQNGPGRLVL